MNYYKIKVFLDELTIFFDQLVVLNYIPTFCRIQQWFIKTTNLECVGNH